MATATKTKTAKSAIPPLSEWTRDLSQNFYLELRYADTRRAAVQAEGDRVLLATLEGDRRRIAAGKARAAIESNPEAMRSLAESRGGRADLSGGEASIADIDEKRLAAIAADVEDRLFPTWRLAGDDDQPLLDRLDRHFAPLQEAKADADRERADAREQKRRQQLNQRLIELKAWAGTWRQQIGELETMIVANEKEAAAIAEQLGVEA